LWESAACGSSHVTSALFGRVLARAHGAPSHYYKFEMHFRSQSVIEDSSSLFGIEIENQTIDSKMLRIFIHCSFQSALLLVPANR
jgi:hypothetical protein